jgi:uncharacterized UPF0160 family protein
MLLVDSPDNCSRSGHFHADEALAVYLLRMLPTYASSPLVRTRDPTLLATCHTVVDVGGEYDYSPERNRYDHHQRDFNTTFPNHSTKLSSAGLVYMHFGKAIIAQHTGLHVDSEEVSILYEKMYDDFVEAFDANDNGISVYNTSDLKKAGLQKKFEDRGFTIASVVSRYNRLHKTTSEPTRQSPEEKQAAEDASFARASTFTGEQFTLALNDAHLSWLPARTVVHESYAQRFNVDKSGRILVLPHRDSGIPWSSHLYDLERTQDPPQPEILYVLFPENGEADSKWRIRSVSVEDGGFDNRKDLPDAWKGLRDEELSKVSGIDGCVFVHASGFIGGNKTQEGALDMARKAVAM